MAVITLGSQTSPTVVGGDATVTTGTAITTLPVSSPITIMSDGTHADSYWVLSTTTLLPKTLTYKVGFGAVADGVLTDHILLYDSTAHEVKKIDGSSVATAVHAHAWADITSGKPTSLAGYGILDSLQPLDADLTAIAALGYASTSFLKKTALNTWSLDTNTYSVSSHVHAESSITFTNITTNDSTAVQHGYLPRLGGGTTNFLRADGTWAEPPAGGGGGSCTGYAPLADPVFTTSFGFNAARWRIVEDGDHVLLKFNSISKAKLEDDGTMSFVGDVVAHATL